MTEQTERTLYIHATIVTVDSSRRILSDGAILVVGNRIAAVDKTSVLLPLHPDAVISDLHHQILMPGLISTHMHLMQSLLRGVADDSNLHSWLQDHIWPLESAYCELDGYHAARLSIAEMLKSGTTTFLESLLTEQAGFEHVVRAVSESGIRGCLGKLTKPQTVDRQGRLVRLDPRDAGPALEKMGIFHTVAAWETYNGSANDRIRVWFGAATPRSAGVKEQHAQMAAVAHEKGIRITMHCAEAPSDTTFFSEAFNETPMEYCVATNLASPALVLAHMVNITQRDYDLLASTGTHIAHCPTSNLKLASGILPLTSLTSNVGLGCDGAPCTNTVDMFREMHLAAILHRGTTLSAASINAERVLEMATINGAKALGLEAGIGSIEVGKKADFIVVDVNDVGCVPNDNVVSNVVFSATGRNVTMTVVDGRVLVKDGVLLCMDEQEVVKEARTRREEIVKRAGVTIAQRWPIV